MPKLRLFVVMTLALLSVMTSAATPPRALAFDTTHELIAHLSGDFEVPAVQTDARGLALFRLTPEGALAFVLSLTNIRDITGIDIYEGASGENGRAIFSMPLEQCSFEAIVAFCQGDVRDPYVVGRLWSSMSSGRAYVNALTAAYPTGEIRGQVNETAPPEPEFMSRLSGRNEMPPIDTQATGLALFGRASTGGVSFMISLANVQDVTGIGIYDGPDSLPIVRVNLAEQCTVRDNSIYCEGGDISVGDPNIAQELLAAIEGGTAFINVLTRHYPAGELAGWIAPLGPPR